MKSCRKFILLAVVAVVTLSFLAGCGGRVFAPREGSTVWYYHPELPEAAKAVEDAQKAGKDKACPDKFLAAKNRMEDAYRAYWACRTAEGIAMAKEATAMAKALCPPAAACTLTASPSQIEAGQSSTLTFTTSGTVESAMLDGQEVPVTGTTKTVRPTATTTYTGQVTGVGGTQTATATVTVVQPAPATQPSPAAPAQPLPAEAKPKIIDKMTIRINFDFDKATIRKQDEAELNKAVEFVKKYPGSKVIIEGYTDSIGTEKYNQKLSEGRAAAVKKYLLSNGVSEKTNISISGHGESKPIASNKTAAGRAENRRVEILITE